MFDVWWLSLLLLFDVFFWMHVWSLVSPCSWSLWQFLSSKALHRNKTAEARETVGKASTVMLCRSPVRFGGSLFKFKGMTLGTCCCFHGFLAFWFLTQDTKETLTGTRDPSHFGLLWGRLLLSFSTSFAGVSLISFTSAFFCLWIIYIQRHCLATTLEHGYGELIYISFVSTYKITYVTHMLRHLLIYVLHMFHICFTYVLHMFHICLTYVLHMSYICDTYVLHMFAYVQTFLTYV